MKVDIKNRQETRGLLKKTTFHWVDLIVVLTEEEKQLIKEHKLADVVIMERNPPASVGGQGGWDLKFSHLVKGKDEYNLSNPAEAGQYQARLIDRLKLAKAHLETMNKKAEDTSIEL